MAEPHLMTKGHLVGYINMVGPLLLVEDQGYSAEEVQPLEVDLITLLAAGPHLLQDHCLRKMYILTLDIKNIRRGRTPSPCGRREISRGRSFSPQGRSETFRHGRTPSPSGQGIHSHVEGYSIQRGRTPSPCWRVGSSSGPISFHDLRNLTDGNNDEGGWNPGRGRAQRGNRGNRYDFQHLYTNIGGPNPSFRAQRPQANPTQAVKLSMAGHQPTNNTVTPSQPIYGSPYGNLVGLNPVSRR